MQPAVTLYFDCPSVIPVVALARDGGVEGGDEEEAARRRPVRHEEALPAHQGGGGGRRELRQRLPAQMHLMLIEFLLMGLLCLQSTWLHFVDWFNAMHSCLHQ